MYTSFQSWDFNPLVLVKIAPGVKSGEGITTDIALNTSTHVSLHYSGFATFVDECSSVDIDSTDIMFITELTTRMSGGYASGLDRMVWFSGFRTRSPL